MLFHSSHFWLLKRFFASAILWDYILIDSGLYTVWNLGLGVSSIWCWLKNVKHCQTQKAWIAMTLQLFKKHGDKLINWRFVLREFFLHFYLSANSLFLETLQVKQQQHEDELLGYWRSPFAIENRGCLERTRGPGFMLLVILLRICRTCWVWMLKFTWWNPSCTKILNQIHF